MVTLLAIKAFLKLWGFKAVMFLETVPYKKQILVGIVVVLVFLGAVRYCSRKQVPDYNIQSGAAEVRENEERRKKELSDKIAELDRIKAEQDARIKQLEAAVERMRRPRNVTAGQLENKARGK
jgi:LPS O-antigen subunit length determinant protein (WzzB/FepE family)